MYTGNLPILSITILAVLCYRHSIVIKKYVVFKQA